MGIIVSWKMSNEGRSSGRWWEVAEVPKNSALRLVFTLHPGRDTRNDTVAIGIPFPPTNNGEPITNLDKELREITDFRIAMFATRAEALKKGKEYEAAKKSGSHINVKNFLDSVSWAASGRPTQVVPLKSKPDHGGLLMIVDWVEGKTLDLDAEVHHP